MPRYQAKTFEQILFELISYVVARSRLSDISDAATAKHILAAAATQDAEQYYQMTLMQKLFSIDTAEGDDLDERAKDIQPALITRNQSVKAVGQLVFSRAGTTGTVIIPQGTKVKTSGNEIFVTTVAGSITPTSPEQISGHGVGRDSDLIAAVAEVPGAAGNVVADTIIKFVKKPAGADEVTNPSAFTQGLDKESDDSFRNRLKRFVASLSRGVISALESAVLGAYDAESGRTILFSKAVEDPINRGYVTLYIDDGTGAAESTTAITDEILTESLGGNADLPDFPSGDTAVGGESYLFLNNKPVKNTASFSATSGIRGALTGGDSYSASFDYWYNPSSGQVNFNPVLSVDEGIKVDYTHYTGLIALAQKIIDGDPNDYANYPGYRASGVLVYVRTPQVLIQNISLDVTIQEGYDHTTVKDTVKAAVVEYINNLGISGDVVLSELIRRVKSVAGIYDVTVVTPTNNVIMLDDQMARTTTNNITVS